MDTFKLLYYKLKCCIKQDQSLSTVILFNALKRQSPFRGALVTIVIIYLFHRYSIHLRISIMLNTHSANKPIIVSDLASNGNV